MSVTGYSLWVPFLMGKMGGRGQDAGAQSIALTFPATRASIPAARHAVTDFAERFVSDPLSVATAVSEAVTNAVLHAYRDDMPVGDVEVHAYRDGSHFVVRVSDEGVGMKPNLNSTGLGLGSTLIAAMASEVVYDSPGQGVRVSMRFPCEDQPG
jgi:anti-sigma regulatory factor (Ser/Thr protein kinase)